MIVAEEHQELIGR